jgi:hypothetical protein
MPLQQVLILDTCAAGQASAELFKLADRREISADQKRAIELLKDSAGSHILMGAAADKVSYESSRYAEGLLTYALLAGMRGEALEEGGLLKVRKWFDTAVEKVPDLAKGIGGIQKPIAVSPPGDSFPIALIRPPDFAQIPLANWKPLLLRAECRGGAEGADEDDDQIHLDAMVRQELRALSMPVIRGGVGTEPPVIYRDEIPGEVADSFQPRIRYWIEKDHVRVRVRLLRDDGQRMEQIFEFPTSGASEVARQVATHVIAMAVGED